MQLLKLLSRAHLDVSRNREFLFYNIFEINKTKLFLYYNEIRLLNKNFHIICNIR